MISQSCFLYYSLYLSIPVMNGPLHLMTFRKSQGIGAHKHASSSYCISAYTSPPNRNHLLGLN